MKMLSNCCYANTIHGICTQCLDHCGEIPEVVVDMYPEMADRWFDIPEWVQKWTLMLAESDKEELDRKSMEYVREKWNEVQSRKINN